MTTADEYAPSAAGWVRRQVERYESTGGREGNKVMGRPIVVITSRGVKSGKLRKNPVMRVEHDGVYAAVGSDGGAVKNPAWVGNFLADPHVQLQDGPEPAAYVARLASGEERDVWWERAVAAFPTYAAYQRKTAREIPLFVLDPE